MKCFEFFDGHDGFFIRRPEEMKAGDVVRVPFAIFHNDDNMHHSRLSE